MINNLLGLQFILLLLWFFEFYIIKPYNNYYIHVTDPGYFNKPLQIFYQTVEKYYFLKAHNYFICFFLRYGLPKTPEFAFAFEKRKQVKILAP